MKVINQNEFNEQTFQLGTRDDGIIGEPKVPYWGKSGSRADPGRDHERVGHEDEVEDGEDGGKKGKAVPDPLLWR